MTRSSAATTLIRLARAGCAVLFACFALVARADELRIGGTGAGLGTLQLLGDAFVARHPAHRVTVLPSMGSGGGIKALLAGAIDIAVAARALTDAEAQRGLRAVEYGRTPFVFATATSNPATSVTTATLVEFYAGTRDRWPDGTAVRLVLRPIGDSDSELIKSMSPAMRDAKSSAEQRKGMLFAVTDQETATNIERIAGGIGPSTLALILSERRALKALALDGVVPDLKTLADGTYPLVKQMYLVTSAKASPAVLDFIAFVGSPEGVALLRRTGHLVK